MENATKTDREVELEKQLVRAEAAIRLLQGQRDGLAKQLLNLELNLQLEKDTATPAA